MATDLRVCFDSETLGATLVRFDKRFPEADDSEESFLSVVSQDELSGSCAFVGVLLHSFTCGAAASEPETNGCKTNVIKAQNDH